MRRKKNNKIALVLIALVLFLGLGYAFLQTDLTINGTGKISASSWNIYFNNIQVTTGSVELAAGDSIPTINSTNLTDISYIVTFKEPGEFYEFTVDVVNDGTIDAMIGTISNKINGTEINTTNPLPTYLSYTITYVDNVPLEVNHILEKNSTETYKVRLEFRTDIDSSDLPTTGATNALSFGVSYVQANSNGIKVPGRAVLLPTNETDTSAFRSDTYRESIKTITLSDRIQEPANVIESWDIGVNQNGDVMAYITRNANDNTKYDLYIQGDGSLNANPDIGYLFYGLKQVDYLNNIEVLDTSKVTNMECMFTGLGYNSHVFTLDLGNNFDTSKVTNMQSMFRTAGYSDENFTLNLGSKFDTSNVENMKQMFNQTGYNSTVFKLNLGDKFDTSKVTTMEKMFFGVGANSQVFEFNMGDKFDTSNVVSMSSMFEQLVYRKNNFTLQLGDKFDTSKVTTMYRMFDDAAYYGKSFTIDLGNNFDTSNVTTMKWMFAGTGYRATTLNINFGPKFNTPKVTDMYGMFGSTGTASSNLVLDLSTFDFTNVTSTSLMFMEVKTSTIIYVKNASDQAWIINKSSNLTTNNVLIKQ